jgi:LysM repeat protein
MKKLGMVLSVAAVATLVGCKDPNYKGNIATSSGNEVKDVEPVEQTPVVKPAPAPQPEPPKNVCMCKPGTKHTSPCMCGADDCTCVVVKPEPVKPVEPEYTIYIVQRGDYLAKISKKYNVRVDSIRRLNPSIKKDIVRVGQKIKLPGKIDVGVQTAPKTGSKAKKASAKKAYVPYSGATKEYVVKSGDSLSLIAVNNGTGVRQLKELNNLSSDRLRVGQKLKVPAAGKATAKASAKPADKPVKKAEPLIEKTADESAVNEEPEVKAGESSETEAKNDASAANKEEAAVDTDAQAPSAPETTTYVVQDGDDMTGVAIRFGVTAATIRDLNNLAEDAQLVPGQVIKLPADVQQ